MKTIKGKVLFLCVPIIGDQVSDEYYSEWLTMVTKQELGESFRLSTITEEHASLLVDYDNDDNYKDYTVARSCFQLKTAKESLFSLLKANGCWIKGWMDEPNINEFKSIPFCESGECSAYFDVVSEYNKTPDDYLLIIKQ